MQVVGAWEEVVGQRGTQWVLERGASYQELLENLEDTDREAGWDCALMAPAAFSPMQ